MPGYGGPIKPGIGPWRYRKRYRMSTQISSTPIGFETLRTPLVFSPQQKKQSGSVDLVPNLLMTTLAVVAVTLPPGKQLSASAPERKAQVQADQYRVPLTLGINPNPATVQWSASAPPRKAPTYCEQPPRSLALGINPNPSVVQLSASAPARRAESLADTDPLANLNESTLGIVAVTLPPGKQNSDSAPQIRRYYYSDSLRPITLGITPPASPDAQRLIGSAPARKPWANVDAVPNLLVSTLAQPGFMPSVTIDLSGPQPKWPVYAEQAPQGTLARGIPAPPSGPVGIQLSDSAPPRKPAVYAEQAPAGILVRGINPNPAIRQWSDSSPQVKYRPQVDVYPNLNVTVFVPLATQPIGQQWFASAPPPKAPVYAVQQHNILAQGINPQPQVRQWDSSAPAIKYQLRVEFYPNLNETTLVPLATLPPGQQLSDSAPPRKAAVYAEQQNRPAIAINPNPRAWQWSESAPWVKYRPQVDITPDVAIYSLPTITPANRIIVTLNGTRVYGAEGLRDAMASGSRSLDLDGDRNAEASGSHEVDLDI